MGILHSQLNLAATNEIVAEGTSIFQGAFKPSAEISQGQKDFDVMRERFSCLLKSFQYFILINRYEYFYELLKMKKKQILAREASKSKESLLFLLKKFMIAIDIHVFLSCGSWSNAADSMYNFLNTFYEYLNFNEKSEICQNAFYLAILGRFSKIYTPDYVVKFLDITFDLDQYYHFKEEQQEISQK